MNYDYNFEKFKRRYSNTLKKYKIIKIYFLFTINQKINIIPKLII
jgi:uncharacterized protein YutD